MTKTKDPYGRNTSTVYRRKIKELKESAIGHICVICVDEGRDPFINVSLPPSEANSPEYWTAEHDPPLSEGGDLIKDIRGPAHRRCNSFLGRQLQLATAIGGAIERSRDW
jgi:hypothetical protein